MTIEEIKDRLKEIGPHVSHEIIDISGEFDPETGKLHVIQFDDDGKATKAKKDLHQFVNGYDVSDVPTAMVFSAFVVSEVDRNTPGWHLKKFAQMMVCQTMTEKLVIDDDMIAEGKARYEASTTKRSVMESEQ